MSGRGSPAHRSGYAAIAGVPNVGKSTLLNALMGIKISIISTRPQTTRRNVVGILSTDSCQVVLVDTPGLLDPAYRLQTAMLAHARNAIEGADVLLLMLDAERALEPGPEPQLRAALAAVGRRTPVILALNKVDRVPKPRLLPLIQQCSELYPFRALVPISALMSDGLEDLLGEVVACLPEGPPLYPIEMVTEQPERFFVAELVREAVFRRFRQEVPYATSTRVEEFRRVEGRKTYLSVTVFVERETQKAILVGKGGKAILKVGTEARRAIEEFLDEPVYLDLQVKVLPDWRQQESHLRELDLL